MKIENQTNISVNEQSNFEEERIMKESASNNKNLTSQESERMDSISNEQILNLINNNVLINIAYTECQMLKDPNFKRDEIDTKSIYGYEDYSPIVDTLIQDYRVYKLRPRGELEGFLRDNILSIEEFNEIYEFMKNDLNKDSIYKLNDNIERIECSKIYGRFWMYPILYEIPSIMIADLYAETDLNIPTDFNDIVICIESLERMHDEEGYRKFDSYYVIRGTAKLKYQEFIDKLKAACKTDWVLTKFTQ